MFAELASLLFYSRDYAHRAHLAAATHRCHVVLDEFYKQATEDLDSLIEAYQGRNGIVYIPTLAAEDDVRNPLGALKSHLQMIEQVQLQDRALDAIVDDICALYLRTIYKLGMN